MTPVLIIVHNPTVWNSKTDEVYNEQARQVSAGKGADHQRGNGSSIVFCVSDITGFEDIISRPNTFVTSYENVKGYNRQVVINGVPQWEDPEETIPTMEVIDPVLPDRAQYDAVYTPNHPDELVAIPGGYDMSHLTL